MNEPRLVDLEGSLTAMIEQDFTGGVEVQADTDLLLTGLVDSIGIVQVVTWLEEHLDIVIDPVDIVLDNFQTVARMVAYIETR